MAEKEDEEESEEEHNLNEVWDLLNKMDNDIRDLHEEFFPEDEEEININTSKLEIGFTIFILSFVFMLGMIIGGFLL